MIGGCVLVSCVLGAVCVLGFSRTLCQVYMAFILALMFLLAAWNCSGGSSQSYYLVHMKRTRPWERHGGGDCSDIEPSDIERQVEIATNRQRERLRQIDLKRERLRQIEAHARFIGSARPGSKTWEE